MQLWVHGRQNRQGPRQRRATCAELFRVIGRLSHTGHGRGRLLAHVCRTSSNPHAVIFLPRIRRPQGFRIVLCRDLCMQRTSQRHSRPVARYRWGLRSIVTLAARDGAAGNERPVELVRLALWRWRTRLTDSIEKQGVERQLLAMRLAWLGRCGSLPPPAISNRH
ncbi:hypothetical protein M441DRAFT_402838 [Trichoderma asperellum CBS 433.97]|uniref:Uncharacterized protein n=1 Tax=Trichoderma asperellum (strain ATCC 204424 / CBS 433.97 / NBRC 101777) TaxID=1042311 RepID=A0A2T3ZA33_TRIA4|nr:hypothetical protein M441DRAFT_402838 [Trichoderma asperellum CBS 433.97]PTB41678.1 hypothetical protein M441DRAFT_402838 [Trichoderma asperellum CBS 433.97]